MDFIRSCYTSRWHPFRDDLDRTIKGRYFFAPQGTPVYPGWHHLGSRDWLDTNWERIQGVGESLTEPHAYDPGRAPVRVPLPIRVGSEACIADGASVLDAVRSRNLTDGFPTACFVTPTLHTNPLETAFVIQRCSTQRAWMNVVSWLYERAYLRIQEFLFSWLGGGFAFQFNPPQGNMPNVLTIVHNDWSIAVCAGTEGFQSLALQGFYSLRGPVDVGGFSTNPIWYDAAQYVNDLLNAQGADPTKPLLLVGHSYGGALSSVLSAMYRMGRPTRPIYLLTGGMPKPGDDRLIDILERVSSVHLANNDDFVTILPFSPAQLAAFVLLVPPLVLTGWGEWHRPTLQLMLNNDGTSQYGVPPLPDAGVMLALLIDVLAGVEEPPIEPHRCSTYVTRLNRRCPEIAWPLPDDANQFFGIADVYALVMKSPLPQPGKVRLVGHPHGVLTTGRVELTSGSTPASGAVELTSGSTPASGAVELTSGSTPAPGAVELTSGSTPASGAVELTSGSTPASGAVELTQLPLLASGNVELTYPYFPNPGTPCSNAATLVLGVTSLWTSSTTLQQWYKITTTAGVSRTVTIGPTGSPEVDANVLSGTNCAGLTLRGSMHKLATPHSVTYTPAAGENIYVVVLATVGGARDYTLLVS